ncbi:MAG: HNH endonuclease [Actinomycetota bacterium]|nr:HNH endonuclease [Actinomycetota bacterium]
MAVSTWSPEETEELRSLHARGVPQRELARRLGRPRSTVAYRLVKIGCIAPPTGATLAARFWRQVERRGADECWPWAGYRDADGYGVLSAWPTQLRAHRFSYELANGPLPPGLCARHRCDNPPCCNPAHLEAGTSIDNNRDKTERGRNATGEQHGMARYTVEQIREVKRLLAAGVARAQISEQTGVRETTVATVALGRQWREVA